MMTEHYTFFATTPKAMESMLTEELQTLGVQDYKATIAGVSFKGDLALAYRVCLWTRIANRVLLSLATFTVISQDELYRCVKAINWFEHINPEDSIAVTFNVKNSTVITNSHFGALKVKDAIVDQMRKKYDLRPSVDTERPNIRINVHLQGEIAQISLDLSGESLHRRGYREVSIAAPIKENLASAILMRSGWPAIAKQKGTLLDPMCGSGTLLLEGAMIAADYAPGLLRDYFGFSGWKKHDATIWQRLIAEAEKRRYVGLTQLPVIVGFDQDRQTVNTAKNHIAMAGLSHKIHIERRDITSAKPAESWIPGLLICNPPYGERLGNEQQIADLYTKFGKTLKNHFIGWKAAMIISNPELGFRLGIRSQKPITLFNGALECKLLRLKIDESEFFEPKAMPLSGDAMLTNQQELIESSEPDGSIEMFVNRLKKNLKKLNKWAKQNTVTCFRAYDADLPDYAVAIDVYQGENRWLNVQEYEPPKTIDRLKSEQRLAAIMAALPGVFNINPAQIFLKIRRKQHHTDQYEKHAEQGRFHQVEEGGCQLLVNFEDYLDTGLFLDHRPMRLLIQQQAKDKRFLNLFAYTGSATVHAAVGGALATTTVDMSNTYLGWAKKNLALNTVQGEHEFIQADCLEWLATESRQANPRQYDVIFLDPPTFSNSKRMEAVFDIQRDHVDIINKAIILLAPQGILYFSTNFRRFKINTEALSGLQIEDISAQTIPIDFIRDTKIHYCWKICK